MAGGSMKVEEEKVEVTQPLVDHVIQEQTEVIQRSVLGHLVKQLAIEVPVVLMALSLPRILDLCQTKNWSVFCSFTYVLLRNSPLYGIS
jgi:hypothetical protein